MGTTTDKHVDKTKKKKEGKTEKETLLQAGTPDDVRSEQFCEKNLCHGEEKPEEKQVGDWKGGGVLRGIKKTTNTQKVEHTL